jgi:DNA processing protein
MNSDDKIALLNLLSVDGIGSATALRLVEHFGSVHTVFHASESQLRGVPRLSEALIVRLKAVKPDGDFGKKQVDKAEKDNIEIRTFWDETYPPILKELESDAPVMLFIRGEFPPERQRLAVVGTRSASHYGKQLARDLIFGLRGSGITIVSGLASGIDGASHEAALEANLPTESVFGCGVDHIYPPQHADLANKILAQGGALISEFPIGVGPDRHHFPQRNRIIAGLSQGTLVVEAGDRSGALITANMAVEYNREVMAVPGAITSGKSSGCHSLIKAGAALIERSEDIQQALSMRRDTATAQPAPAQLHLEGPEAQIAQVLDAVEARHIDLIAQHAGMGVGETLGQLLLLELKGAVKQLPGKYFVRT